MQVTCIQNYLNKYCVQLMIPAKLGTHDLHLTNCVFTQYSPHSLHWPYVHVRESRLCHVGFPI